MAELQRKNLAPKDAKGGARPKTAAVGLPPAIVRYRSCLASIYRPASSNPAYLRSTRDSFMVFRESKSLARTLAPLVKKSEALAWMKPVWARQALDAFLFECYKVLPP